MVITMTDEAYKALTDAFYRTYARMKQTDRAVSDAMAAQKRAAAAYEQAYRALHAENVRRGDPAALEAEARRLR